MKKLIAMLCAIGLSGAQAAEFSLPNNAGGEIRLTDAACPDADKPNWMIAFTYNSSGKVTYGCWFVKDGLVHVTYRTGDSRVYPAHEFKEIRSNSSKRGAGV